MKKTFNHNFVQQLPLVQQRIDGTKYYLLPNSEKYKSVTTILSEKMDKTALHKWRKQVGEEEANKISTQAALRGKVVHNMVEKYVLNEDICTHKQMPSNIDTFMMIKGVLDSSVDNILGIELPMYSKALKAAGRTDLVAEYNGIVSIIDYKTSRKLKKEEWIESYFLQSTVYSMMFEQIYKIPVPQIVIAITVDHEPEPQIFVKNRGLYVNRVLDLFVD